MEQLINQRKCFILPCSLIDIVKQLPNDQAGILFKSILRYVNGLDPKTDDILVNNIFENIKHTIEII